MNRLEILAPAGGPESLEPAVRCGADAVYLGAARFSARGAAQNFDREELAAAVRRADEAMGRAAQKRINEHFLWQNSAEQALAMLEQKGVRSHG